jgi:hypothetical protein
MDEIAPGILHWTTYHEGIGQTVHSHLHTASGAIFDPRLPDGGVDALAHAVLPTVVLLSSRHHLRNSAAVADAYDVPIKVSEPGLWDLQDDDDPEVETFAFGEEVAQGVTTIELPALAPDETVFHIDDADGKGALLFGDSLLHHDGKLAYVPDGLMGDDPAAVKRGLTGGLQRILDEAAPFDALLFAHGAPIARGGRDKLEAFVAAQA